MERDFINPFFDASKGSDYLKDMQNKIEMASRHPLFVQAFRQLPVADLRLIESKAKESFDHLQLGIKLVIIRWANPICDECLDKKNPGALYPCERCGLTFYCGPQCQEKHRQKHSQRCCNPDGPVETGPMTPIILSVVMKQK